MDGDISFSLSRCRGVSRHFVVIEVSLIDTQIKIISFVCLTKREMSDLIRSTFLLFIQLNQQIVSISFKIFFEISNEISLDPMKYQRTFVFNSQFAMENVEEDTLDLWGWGWGEERRETIQGYTNEKNTSTSFHQNRSTTQNPHRTD